MKWIILFLIFIYQQKVGSSDPENNQPTVMSPDQVKILTLNDPSGTATTENDETKYTFKQDGYVFFYTFNEDANCSKCSYGDNVIWEKTNDNQYPKALSFHSDLFMVFFQFADHLQLYAYKDVLSDDGQSQGKFIQIAQTAMGKVSPSRMKFFIEPPEDPSNPKLVSLDGINQGFQFEYDLKDIKCFEVKYGFSSVWRHEFALSNSQHPKSVHLNIFTNKIFITFDIFYLVYDCSGDNNKCEFECKSSLSDFTENSLKFMAKGTTTSLTAVPSSNIELLKYPDGFTYVFTLNERSNCVQVLYNDKTLWRLDSGKTPVKSVYVNLSVKCLMLETYDAFFVYMHTDTWNMIFNSGFTSPIPLPSLESLDEEAEVTPETTSNLRGDDAEEVEVPKVRKTKEARKPRVVVQSKFNTMSLMLILGGVILVLLFLAVLIKLCIR